MFVVTLASKHLELNRLHTDDQVCVTKSINGYLHATGEERRLSSFTVRVAFKSLLSYSRTKGVKLKLSYLLLRSSLFFTEVIQSFTTALTLFAGAITTLTRFEYSLLVKSRCKDFTTSVSTILISAMAKAAPMQRRAPPPKERRSKGEVYD